MSSCPKTYRMSSTGTCIKNIKRYRKGNHVKRTPSGTNRALLNKNITPALRDTAPGVKPLQPSNRDFLAGYIVTDRNFPNTVCKGGMYSCTQGDSMWGQSCQSFGSGAICFQPEDCCGTQFGQHPSLYYAVPCSDASEGGMDYPGQYESYACYQYGEGEDWSPPTSFDCVCNCEYQGQGEDGSFSYCQEHPVGLGYYGGFGSGGLPNATYQDCANACGGFYDQPTMGYINSNYPDCSTYCRLQEGAPLGSIWNPTTCNLWSHECEECGEKWGSNYDYIGNGTAPMPCYFESQLPDGVAVPLGSDIGQCVEWVTMIRAFCDSDWPSGDDCHCFCTDGAYIESLHQQIGIGGGDCDSDGECEVHCLNYCENYRNGESIPCGSHTGTDRLPQPFAVGGEVKRKSANIRKHSTRRHGGGGTCSGGCNTHSDCPGANCACRGGRCRLGRRGARGGGRGPRTGTGTGRGNRFAHGGKINRVGRKINRRR